ncbi:MAG: thioredoxin [Candidatus Hodarchaeales archaeon]|jgi:thioredoxin 1
MEVLIENNFQSMIEDGETPIFVDFWAQWCRPCLAIAPTIEALAEEYEGKMRFGKCNTDENPSIATKYRIMSIPLFIIFHKGEIVEKFVGAQPKKKFVEVIDKALKKIE